MSYRHPDPWIVDLIPGTSRLVREAEKAMAKLDAARGESARLAAIAQPLTASGKLHEEHHNPARGVSRAEMQAAVDAWREARAIVDDPSSSGLRAAYDRALDSVDAHVTAGLRDAATAEKLFLAADAAQARAEDALAELRAALAHRDNVDAILGAYRGELPYFGMAYTLNEVEKRVKAIPKNGYALAVSLVEAMDLSPDAAQQARDALREVAVRPGAETSRADKEDLYREILVKYREGIR